MVKVIKRNSLYCFCVAGTKYWSRKDTEQEAALELAAFAEKCGCYTDARLLVEYAVALK